jgi:hypothetical protein
MRGSTRTTRASHWKVSCLKSRKNRIVAPITYVLLVSKKIPDVLIIALGVAVELKSYVFCGERRTLNADGVQ